MAADDVRALLDPLAAILAARPRFRTIPQRSVTPAPTPEIPDPPPIITPARVEVYTDPADLPEEITTGAGVDLGAQIALVQAALAQSATVELRAASAQVTLPTSMAADTDYDLTAAWAGGPTQTVPVVVSTVAAGPGPLQVRAITVQTLAATTTGVTVRLRARRALLGLDPDDRYDVNAIYSYSPPFEETP
ncbi:MAG: hypothetical protein L0I24_10890 [Pseudonocardia sp.]|nr:hypothetical protein [Pseudonocardia sp.]